MKDASFSMADRKRRWCDDCKPTGSGDHRTRPLCETCATVAPSFGMPDAPTRRWCAGCAKTHTGAVKKHPRKKCEDCHVKVPSWGMADGKKKMWCARCAKANHPGAVMARSSRAKKRAEKEDFTGGEKRQRR